MKYLVIVVLSLSIIIVGFGLSSIPGLGFDAGYQWGQQIAQQNPLFGLAFALGFVALGTALYLTPAIIAAFRHHRNVGALIVLNVLLGWTLLVWVACLAWACSADVTVPEPREDANDSIKPFLGVVSLFTVLVLLFVVPHHSKKPAVIIDNHPAQRTVEGQRSGPSTDAYLGGKLQTEPAEEYDQGIKKGMEQYKILIGHPFTPAGIYAKFKENEIAAESELNGHTIFILGTISQIETEWSEGARVTFPLGSEGFTSVVCHIDRDHMAAFARLHPGDTIEVSCDNPRMVVDSLQVQDCSLEFVQSLTATAQ